MNKIKKSIRYTGIQPQYFPRLHYIARIIQTDIFVLRDDAQFVRKHKYPDGKTDKSYQAHTPIKQASGRFLLGVPTQHDGFIPLHKTKISYSLPWVQDHIKAFQISYGKAQNYTLLQGNIESLLSTRYESLSSLNTATLIWSLLYLLEDLPLTKDKLTLGYINKILPKQKHFRLKAIREASKSNALQNTMLTTNEKIVELIKEYGANEDYCGGTGVSAYIDHDIFKKNGITIAIQDWKCSPYPQQFYKKIGFIANLSILDLLFNMPLAKARTVVTA